MKKIWVLFIILSLVGSGFAYAADDMMLISTNTNAGNQVIVNGAPLEKTFIKDDSGNIMLPLKAVAEAFGYQVVWLAENKEIELIKDTRSIVIKTKVNEYTFNKMTPMALRVKASLKNGSTYVPMEFAENFLQAGAFESNNSVEVLSTLDENVATGGFVITAIEKDKIIVSFNDGESHVMLNKETTFSDYETQKTITLSDLKVGDTIKVTHPAVMIMIYPAQYNAFHVERINKVAYTEGTILSIQEDSILVKGSNMTLQINIDASTSLSNPNNEAMKLASLRVGNQVKVYHSLAMTKSIPPQSLGFKIIVDSFIK